MQAYEFTDTLIMVLKKNERQISFLHIYHHATTFFPCWCASQPCPVLITFTAHHGCQQCLRWPGQLDYLLWKSFEA